MDSISCSIPCIRAPHLPPHYLSAIAAALGRDVSNTRPVTLDGRYVHPSHLLVPLIQNQRASR